MIIIILIAFTEGFTLSQVTHPVINELQASNTSTIIDPDFNEYSDWIEIHNPGATSENIGGYFLTDNPENHDKWMIPEGVTIEAGGFMLFWADGKNENLTGYHTNYKLQKEGEEIRLYDAAGILVDSLVYQQQITDNSYGRHPDGDLSLYFFYEPTPGATNNSSYFLKSAPPEFSVEAGFYSREQKLVLSASSPDANIFYTTNNFNPTITSKVYTDTIIVGSRSGQANFYSEIPTNDDPLLWLPEWVPPQGEVFKATVIRARVFEQGKVPSEIITKSYFVDSEIEKRYPTIAVISLVSEYKNLFDDATGIYVPGDMHIPGDPESGNYFQDWEKTAHIEFFEPDGKAVISQDVGISIQGGTSPASPQKGLHVFARNEYDNNRIDYPIFKDSRTKAKELDEFKRFIIRAWGSTILAGLFNDAYAQDLMAESDLDLQAYRPAVVFINGEYWGLHELREANKNSWYYQYHYGVDREDPGIDLIIHGENNGRPDPEVDEGDANHWNAMVNYIKNRDMSDMGNYEYIKTQMDVENFIAYMGHCIYTGKWDWPDNNEASWRPRTADGKWKWIQYDMETSFGVAEGLGEEYSVMGPEVNMIKQVTEGQDLPYFGYHGPHHILIELLENHEFEEEFLKWFVIHMEAELSPAKMHARLDSFILELEPYLQEYRHRWPFSSGEINSDWDYQMDRIRNFIDTRPAYMLQHLTEKFGELPVVSFSDIPPGAEKFELMQNYPNPAGEITSLSYYIPRAEHVIIRIYNLSGQEKLVLNNGHQLPGHHTIPVNLKDFGRGVYYYVMTAGEFVETKKMVILR